MAQEPPQQELAKITTTKQGLSVETKARHFQMPGAFTDDEAAQTSTRQVDDGTSTSGEALIEPNTNQPKNHASLDTTDNGKETPDLEFKDLDATEDAGIAQLTDSNSLEEWLGIESYMKVSEEMESGHCTVLGSLSQHPVYEEDQQCDVEDGLLVWDSPDLDHLDRLRALEEATLRYIEYW